LLCFLTTECNYVNNRSLAFQYLTQFSRSISIHCSTESRFANQFKKVTDKSESVANPIIRACLPATGLHELAPYQLNARLSSFLATTFWARAAVRTKKFSKTVEQSTVRWLGWFIGQKPLLKHGVPLLPRCYVIHIMRRDNLLGKLSFKRYGKLICCFWNHRNGIMVWSSLPLFMVCFYKV